MFDQILIGLRKWPAAKKPGVSRKRRRMGSLENQVSGSINKRSFFLGIVTPEDEDQVIFLAGQLMNDGVSESFPAFVLVRTGLASSNCECGIEKEYSLFDPSVEIARSMVWVS